MLKRRPLRSPRGLARVLSALLVLAWFAISTHLISLPAMGGEDVQDCRLQSTPRIMCMVPTLYNKADIASLNAILDSWGKYCNSIQFFTEPGGDVPLPKDLLHRHRGLAVPIVVLDDLQRNGHVKQCFDDPTGLVPSPCTHTWEKTWRMLLKAAKTSVALADYFVKVDDDTLIFPENIRGFLRDKGWRPNDIHYFGHELFQVKDEPKSSYAAGSAYGFSRGALKVLEELLDSMQHFSMDLHESQVNDWTVFTCYDRPGGLDDVMIGRCLHSVGIAVEDASDNAGGACVALLQGDEWNHFPEYYQRGKSLLRLRPGIKQLSVVPMALHAASFSDINVRMRVWASIAQGSAPTQEGKDVAAMYPAGYLDTARQNMKYNRCL